MTAPAIRAPRRDELGALVAIEREAGALFATVGMPEELGAALIEHLAGWRPARAAPR